ncbi:uncharacterized protein RHOBADRAFT_45522 [Rhodotorula graminis WP1]|uniref:Uncharacterized protein n=1 Tax=Rhodotorula graminis (strain WP1) TaxID=578459 RepID=A0A0P9H0Y0_RHOGW|nr:uncharacterized protein RHOBADRAFT_45522 [Rhodotorula graminis WP1]KPV73562.1 hypothetical protein RHOBADRAFT_45522 [Rhodotorula graminis WP1]
MTLVEPTSPPTIPTHRRRLSLKILTSPFRRTPDASTHDTRADGSSSADACVDEAARASPLERTSTQGSSTGPKKLRRRSLSNVVKLAKPSGTKDERLDEAGARSTTVDWAKRTAGHPLPQRPPSLKVERSTVHAPLLVELDSLRSGPSTYTPDPPGPARPAVASLPPCTGLPFPSRPKPAAARGPPRSATADVEQEPVASSSSERRPQLSQSSSLYFVDAELLAPPR